MLYIGYFDFVEDESHHGFFTCVAEADSVDAALEKFRLLIRSKGNKDGLFAGIQDIFLDGCIEASAIPEAGLLVHCTSCCVDKYRSSVYTSVRGAESDQCLAYGQGELEEDGEECEREPFISF